MDFFEYNREMRRYRRKRRLRFIVFLIIAVIFILCYLPSNPVTSLILSIIYLVMPSVITLGAIIYLISLIFR